MPITPEPVRPIALDEIRAARERIAKIILRTPLVRLELGPDQPEIRLKLENLQPINAYKLRGAANAVALLAEPERLKGVWTISAGNAGQGVAYAARQAGVPCTVVAFETAPVAKIERMKALGARLDWQGLIQQQPQQARQGLRKLLEGRLVFAPTADGTAVEFTT
jgi:threonine dehydratase